MAKPLLIDSHAHIDGPEFDKDRDEVVQRALEAGVGVIINVGCWDEKAGFDRATVAAERYPSVRTALGIHPHDAEKIRDGNPFALIRELAAGPLRVVAIGETGLDFHYTNSPEKDQKRVFVEHIRLAVELGLPLIVHSREAETETMEILEGEGAADGAAVVLHCFSGGQRMASSCLEAGFYLSFSGVVTFPKAEELRSVVGMVPIERILVETDCPFLAPVPHRGRRNEPSFVVDTLRIVAELKGLSYDDAARITTHNADTFFKLGLRAGAGAESESMIAYPIRDSLYLNITNKCTNTCSFCAKFSSFTVKGHYLKLSTEPSFEEILAAVGEDYARYDEVVFCGFGEPLLRLETVKRVGRYLKSKGCRIRIDTDGMACLVHGRNILPELDFVDSISVSLNAPDPASYLKVISSPYGDKAWEAVVSFIREAKLHIPEVVATAVSAPGIDVEAVRRLATGELGVAFRKRDYNEVG